MPVTLRNKARRLQVFVLPHNTACDADHCHCTRHRTGVTSLHPKTGAKVVHAKVRKLAASVTFIAAGHDGDTVGNLPNNVVRVPEIAAAIKRRELVVVSPEQLAKEAEAAEPPPATPPTTDAPETTSDHQESAQ